MWKTQPTAFGWFHIVGLIILVLCFVFGIYFGKKYTYEKYGRKIDIILGFIGVALVCLELAKQIYNCISFGGYNWSYFPFQICSIDLYLLPCMFFLNKGRVKNTFLGYIGFTSLVAAAFYFVKPAAAFNTPYILLSIHSFLWHFILVFTGVFTINSYNLLKKENLKAVISGYVFFVGLVLIALLVNEVNNVTLILKGSARIDYMYINSKNKAFYPLLNIIFKGNTPTPYPIYFISFLIYYGIGIASFYGLGKLIDFTEVKIKAKKA